MRRVLVGAVALVALGAAPAFAAATYEPPAASDLAQIRQCESGGNYAIDTGNGYYGAYQFADATWAEYENASTYPHASDAPASVQDDAASRLWQDQGTQPWPTCAKGLTATPVSQAVTPPPGDSSSIQGYAVLYRGGHVSAPAPQLVSAARPVVAAAATGTVTAPKTSAATLLPPTVTPSRRVTTLQARPVGFSPVTPTGFPAFDGHTITTADVNTTRTDVMQWQQRMQDRGWNIAVDGEFGTQSANVAAAFSKEKNVVDTKAGEVGQKVWNAAWQFPVT